MARIRNTVYCEARASAKAARCGCHHMRATAPYISSSSPVPESHTARPCCGPVEAALEWDTMGHYGLKLEAMPMANAPYVRSADVPPKKFGVDGNAQNMRPRGLLQPC